MSQLPKRRAALYRYQIPLLAPLRIGNRQINTREGLIVELQEGPHQGLGEAAPLPGFSKETLSQTTAHLIDQLPHWLKGQQPSLTLPSAAFAVDCACREINHPTSRAGSAPNPPYPLLSGSDHEIINRWQNWPSPIPGTAKLKLGRQPLVDDIALLRKLAAIAPNTRFRIDANRAWSLQQASKLVEQIPRSCIDYLEEPCHKLSDTLILAHQQGVFIALDESAREANFTLPSTKWLRSLILKPSLTGSISHLSKIIRQAQQRDISVILSSSYESSLGISHLQQLAQQFTPQQPAGIDTLQLFSANLLRPLQTDKPTLEISDMELLWNS